MLLFNDFCKNLSDNLKLVDELFISSTLDNCLNDFKLEQKKMASSTVVLPALLWPYNIEMFFLNSILSKDRDLKSWIERDVMRTFTHA